MAILAAEQLTITCSPGLQFICGSGRHKAVGELPAHEHKATVATATLTGDVGHIAHDSQYGMTVHTGVFSVTTTSRGNGDSGGSAETIHFNGSHSHSVNISNAGNGQSHNNLQPYIAVFMWCRIA